MARDKGEGVRKRDESSIFPERGRKQRAKFFYLNGKLHKTIYANRAGDLLIAWSYPDRARVTYILSDAKRLMQKAFDLREVTIMINRSRVHIERLILDGCIKAPQKMYSLDGKFKPGKYKFSEDDVMALHDYLLTVHVGRPRKDGLIKPGPMPSKAELRAMMRNNQVLYVKGKDGEFAPVWKAVEW